jgi:hypothetical protein
MATKSKLTETIADDLIKGGPQIARELGIPYRQLTYLVANGRLEGAVTKLGPKLLIASRSGLRRVLGLIDKSATAA